MSDLTPVVTLAVSRSSSCEPCTGLNPEGNEPPAIWPRAHLVQSDDAPTAEMVAHHEIEKEYGTGRGRTM